LIERPDGPAYVVSNASSVSAYRASDLGSAVVSSERIALEIAVDHARRRGLDAAKAAVGELADYDQWTVPNRFDAHRPLFRVALNDAAGTDLYVSSVTGEVLLQTTRHQRLWNYAGSVVHWIYPTVLRSNWAAWDTTVWWLSLVAVIVAASGALLGTIRIRKAWRRIVVSMRSWHAWHHVLGLLSMTFILTWSVSGWLSMDHGRLFSRGIVTGAEAVASAAKPTWTAMKRDALRRVSPNSVEIEWFALGDVIYQREQADLSTQVLRRVDGGAPGPFLNAEDISRWVLQFATDCRPPVAIQPGDNYAAVSVIPGAPVYRATCGDVWFHVDGANGVLLERLNPSRRAYRWLYSALHTVDVPILLAYPLLRSGLIVGLCMLGFVFSATGVVLGWRRLRPR
jgi:hypothetical protein